MIVVWCGVDQIESIASKMTCHNQKNKNLKHSQCQYYTQMGYCDTWQIDFSSIALVFYI